MGHCVPQIKYFDLYIFLYTSISIDFSFIILIAKNNNFCCSDNNAKLLLVYPSEHHFKSSIKHFFSFAMVLLKQNCAFNENGKKNVFFFLFNDMKNPQHFEPIFILNVFIIKRKRKKNIIFLFQKNQYICLYTHRKIHRYMYIYTTTRMTILGITPPSKQHIPSNIYNVFGSRQQHQQYLLLTFNEFSTESLFYRFDITMLPIKPFFIVK